MLRPLRWLPKAVTSRRIFRRWLSKFVKARLNFRGYFDLYNIPFKHISLLDFTEKKSPLKPGGMNRGPNIFDFLEMRDISYHVSEPERGEDENLKDLIEHVEREVIDFAFVYWPELDGLLHRVGNQSMQIAPKLQEYEARIKRLMAAAQKHYDDVRLYVFSDHGMANCDDYLDLRAKIDALPVKIKKDYAVVYDSTMARFWFFNDHARRIICEALKKIPQGRVLPNHELKTLRAYFPDHYFGEIIFLVNEGTLIVPSHMGERPIRAMHGYHPRDKHSYAALMTNQPEIPDDIVAIPDIHKLMVRDAVDAKSANSGLSKKIIPLETEPFNRVANDNRLANVIA
jgi:predicted AlkP superfamily pyrophosphatase or phosphodiesterase